MGRQSGSLVEGLIETEEMLPAFFSGASQKYDKKAGAIWTAVSRPQGKCQDGTRHFGFAYESNCFRRPSLVGNEMIESLYR